MFFQLVLHYNHILLFSGMQIVYPKSDDQRQRLNDAVKNILLFKNLALVSHHFIGKNAM